MDHGEKYWIKQPYDYQKSEIHLELARLVEYWGKTPRNVNLLMNRVIKYTTFSINDPKNKDVKEDLLEILEIEKQYKADPDNLELEKTLLSFFSREADMNESYDEIDELLSVLEERTPNSIISINRYDEEDKLIDTLTGTFQGVFSRISNPDQYYYRVAVLDQNTIRERVKKVYFGVKTSCIGGLEFSISESINRFLNKLVNDYCKGKEGNFFYLLCRYQWYTSKLNDLTLNTRDEMEGELEKIRLKYPLITEVKDLNDLKGVTGIYIMVLDKYHVFYIGQADDIKQRVMRHWSRSDYFTGTGIDLFKAFDTTRLYALRCEHTKMNEIENQMTQLVNSQYTLNVLTGGDLDYHLDNNLPLVDWKKYESKGLGVFSYFDRVDSLAKRTKQGSYSLLR